MAERSLRLAVFDCDGTLVDSLGAIAAAMARSFETNGLPPPTPHDVQGIVGLPLLDAIDRISPEGADLERLRDGYAHAYRELIADPAMHEPLYEGALDALAALDEDRFVTLKTRDDGPGKPNPHMLIEAMAEVGADPANTIMIGDTTFDIVMAANAGVASIGVTWGYHGAAELKAAGAAHLALVFEDVAPAFERLTGGLDATA
jgi:phosphoglycolate phosphatase